jgi:CheY-like chemotaxis protein
MSDPQALILVVDDDDFTAQLTAMILDAAGYRTIVAEGGPDALEKLVDNPEIRIVVSDMDMPFIDGVQLFAECRQQGYKQPFMLLTGKDAAPLRLAHPELDAVLTKDEQLPDVLPNLIESLLAGADQECR